MKPRLLLRLAAASAWNRRLPLALAVGAVALACALMLTTERLREGLRSGFSQALSGTDLIVAARSHPIQILLATVFHMGQPAQNISRGAVDSLASLPQVAWVVPIALGDSYRGHPVVATTSAFFRHIRTGDRRPLEFGRGQAFADGGSGTGPHPLVLGATVADRLGLTLGARVVLSHGTGVISGSDHDQHPFQVVGILEATGTPIDRSLFIALEAHQALHSDWIAGLPPGRSSPRAGAARTAPATAATALPSSLTAALVGLHQRGAVFTVQRSLEAPRAEPLSAVLPGVALDELWQVVGQAERLVQLTGILVAVAALAGLAGVMLAGLESRRRELAVLRSLGAPPGTLVQLVVWEGAIVAAISNVLGFMASAVTLLAFEPWLRARLGIELGSMIGSVGDLGLVLGIQACAMIVSALPGWRALRLSLADGLTPPH